MLEQSAHITPYTLKSVLTGSCTNFYIKWSAETFQQHVLLPTGGLQERYSLQKDNFLLHLRLLHPFSLH